MIFLVQFEINKHFVNFLKKKKKFFFFKKFTSAYLFQIAREKSCDYLLITYVKKFKMVKQKKRKRIT